MAYHVASRIGITLLTPIIAASPRRPLICLAASDAALRDALSFALHHEGLEVLAFDQNGFTATDRLGTASCLVIDHRPPALDGFTVLTRARCYSIAPAVLLASAANATLLQHASAAYVHAVLERPLLGNSLIEHVWAAVRTHDLRENP